MCKVSVIIPVYNVEKWLGACLDSVLAQTLTELEVICVDDASPDGSGAIMDAYAARDRRIRNIHLAENHMQGYARNRGLKASRGKYVYFLDSDDMIEPDAMETLYAAAEKESLDAVFFDSRMLVEDPEIARTRYYYEPARHGRYEDDVYTGPELYRAFWRQGDWNVYVQRTFWRRDFLLENGLFFPEPHIEHEDELFVFEAILTAQRARYLRRDLFIYRIRANSVMTRGSHPKDFFGYFVIFHRIVDFLRSHGLQHDDECVGNAVHIYEVMMNHYPTFMQDPDPEGWFSGRDDEALFTFFCWTQAARETLRRRYSGQESQPSPLVATPHEEPEDLWTPVRSFRKLYLYGAGRMAEAAFRRLLLGGLVIEGFIVTDKQGNPDRLHGFPVYAADELELPGDAAVIVALHRALHEEISRALTARGWRHFLYANANLTTPDGQEQSGDRKE